MYWKFTGLSSGEVWIPAQDLRAAQDLRVERLVVARAAGGRAAPARPTGAEPSQRQEGMAAAVARTTPPVRPRRGDRMRLFDPASLDLLMAGDDEHRATPSGDGSQAR